MIIKVLFGQRKGHYEGQYAPEALSCITETAYEEYPEVFDNMVNAYKDRIYTDDYLISIGDFITIEVADIVVDGAALDKLLQPKSRLIEGSIRKEGE